MDNIAAAHLYKNPHIITLALEFQIVLILDCSFKRNATCDSTGNATLNTAEFYKKYNDCYWSLRDKDDIKIDKVNPSLNLAVQCTRPEILVKVHCITPKDVFLTCYMIVNQTNTKNPEWISDGEPHHRNWVFVFIPVSLSLVVISALAVMYRKRG
ncbi:uncharacterized protein Hap1MRO34_006055 isoform 3-T3 [Clarias gariepinus]